MARKDLLKGLMSGDTPSPAPPRPARGAIGAVSRSIADLKDRALVDVPADLIDMAGISDRLDDDEDDIRVLAESIRNYGQQVPVMLRYSPNHEGRYEVIYGRRRVAALKLLGQQVRAMIRNLDDRDLILAQGQENAARKDLSFIEKALFADAMVRKGFDRATICDALHIDKTVVSRMLQVVDTLPERLLRAIGAAPSAGRDRWLALAKRIGDHDTSALVKAALGPDSDARFKAVYAAAGRPANPRPSALPLEGLGQARRGNRGTIIELTAENAEFAQWLLDNMHELHRDWASRREKD